jgi:DNA ligase-4
VDKTLLLVASRSRFSSPEVRACASEKEDKDITSLLSILYARLPGRESKWLTRMILKTYSPVVIPEALTYRCYHHLLPGLLKIQNEIPAALALLTELKGHSSLPGAEDLPTIQRELFQNVKPLVGVKVGRQTFFKARSIKSCVDMAQNRRMSIEKKYDGEYFQLHVDMSQSPGHRIKIFSKSGKDSTDDRIKVHRCV